MFVAPNFAKLIELRFSSLGTNKHPTVPISHSSIYKNNTEDKICNTCMFLLKKVAAVLDSDSRFISSLLIFLLLM